MIGGSDYSSQASLRNEDDLDDPKSARDSGQILHSHAGRDLNACFIIARLGHLKDMPLALRIFGPYQSEVASFAISPR
jgi:hypothetical protein